jgi:hypothetical protein
LAIKLSRGLRRRDAPKPGTEQDAQSQPSPHPFLPFRFRLQVTKGKDPQQLTSNQKSFQRYIPREPSAPCDASAKLAYKTTLKRGANLPVATLPTLAHHKAL